MSQGHKSTRKLKIDAEIAKNGRAKAPPKTTRLKSTKHTLVQDSKAAVPFSINSVSHQCHDVTSGPPSEVATRMSKRQTFFGRGNGGAFVLPTSADVEEVTRSLYGGGGASKRLSLNAKMESCGTWSRHRANC